MVGGKGDVAEEGSDGCLVASYVATYAGAAPEFIVRVNEKLRQ